MIMVGEWAVEAQLHVFFATHFSILIISKFQFFLKLFSILDFIRLDNDLLSRILLMNFKVFTWQFRLKYWWAQWFVLINFGHIEIDGYVRMSFGFFSGKWDHGKSLVWIGRSKGLIPYIYFLGFFVYLLNRNFIFIIIEEWGRLITYAGTYVDLADDTHIWRQILIVVFDHQVIKIVVGILSRKVTKRFMYFFLFIFLIIFPLNSLIYLLFFNYYRLLIHQKLIILLFLGRLPILSYILNL